MASELVRVQVADAIATLTLNDSSTLNACSLDMAAALHDAVRRIGTGADGVRAMILTGEGRAFCSGANLGATAARTAGERPDLGSGLESTYHPMVTALRGLGVPWIAAVNGAAAGIGCSMALAADLIVAGESAYFLQAFRRIGLVPDGGSTWFLPRMVGRARAMELALLGDKLPAGQALDWGLINRVVPDGELLATARDLALRLATGPASLKLTRRLINDAEAAGWQAQLDAERDAQREAGRTHDAMEGVAAFLAKRPAAFTGA